MDKDEINFLRSISLYDIETLESKLEPVLRKAKNEIETIDVNTLEMLVYYFDGNLFGEDSSDDFDERIQRKCELFSKLRPSLKLEILSFIEKLYETFNDELFKRELNSARNFWIQLVKK